MDINIPDWVKAARLHKQFTQEELALELGFSTKASISAMERGRSHPTFETMLQISKICSYPLPYQNIFPVKTSVENAKIINIPLYREPSSYKHTGGAMTNEINKSILIPEFILKDSSVKIDSTIAIRMTGNSLYPVIPDSSIVLLDTSSTVIIDGKIYCFIHGGLTRIRRIYNLPNNIIKLNSFNDREYPDEIIDKDEIEVIGKAFTWIAMSN